MLLELSIRLKMLRAYPITMTKWEWFDMSQERKEQVFVHEMLHACFFEAGYTEQDEDAINRVSAILYQVLKDNAICFGKKVVYTDCGDKINICN